MSDRQTKNITKAIATVLLCVLVGEGIFGLGFFWPFLLIMLEWRGVYWLSFVVGVLISAIYRIPVGLPSMFLVIVTGGLSLIFGSRKETGLVILIVSLLAGFVFDKVFGLPWGVFDVVVTTLAWFVAVNWFEKGESIKINY